MKDSSGCSVSSRRTGPLACRSISFCLALLTLFSLSPRASGQEPERRFSEKTIYVPYDKLEAIFEKDERGVFLPYREFIELWAGLTPALATATVEKPPIDGVLVAAEYRGRVEGKVALFDAHLEFRSLKNGVALVPLDTEGLSISGATVTRSIPDNAAPESATSSAGPGNAFLATVDGKTTAVLPRAGTYHFALQLMAPVTEEPGRKVIRFKGPRTSVSRFELSIPEEDVEFSLQPASAFTHVRNPEGGTRLSAFFGAANAIEVTWSTQRVESGLPAVLFADVNQKITFSEGATRSDAQISVQILLSGVQETRLTLPSTAQVLAVNASNLKSWDVATLGDQQTLAVQLHTPARDFLNLSVSYEIPSATVAGVREVPMLIVEGTRRQSGNLSFFTPPTLEIRPESTDGVTQEAVPADANPRPVFVYRYLKTPYQLSFAVSPTVPRVEANVYTLVEVGLDKWFVQSRVDYTVKKAGVFSVELNIPEGFTLVDVTGADKLIDDYRVIETNGVRRLQVELGNKMEGTFSILIRAEKPWVTPGTETPVSLAIPFFQPVGADPVEGYLGVSIQPSLTANINNPGTARAEDISHLGSLPAPTPGLATSLTLGFRYRGETEAPVVAFQRRKARVSATVMTLAEVRADSRKLTTTIEYQIDYAGVDEFSFQVPAASEEFHITGESIKERSKVEENGIVTWKITLQSKQLGRYPLVIEHETSESARSAGAAESASSEIRIPEILPLGVYRLSGYSAILKDGNLEVTPVVDGLEAIDNKELPGQLQRPDVFLAYRYDRGSESQKKAWSLVLRVVRHAYVEVPASIINLAQLRTVITKEGHQTCEVIYHLQNKRSQYLELTLPENARILSDIFIGERSEQPSIREKDKSLLIRLGGPGDPNKIIPVRLVYELEGERRSMGMWGTLKVTPPLLKETRVLQTWWTVWVPKEYDYPRIKGPMQEAAFGTPDWDRLRSSVDWAVPNVGINAPPLNYSDQPPPQQTTAAAASGLNVQIVEEGKKLLLHRLAEPAEIGIKYRKHLWTVVLEILAFVIAIVLGVWLVKMKKLSRAAYCVTAGVLAVLISVLAAPRAAGPWQAFYCGVLVLAIAWGGSHLLRMWRNRPRTVPPAPSTVYTPPPSPQPVKDTSPPVTPSSADSGSREDGNE